MKNKEIKGNGLILFAEGVFKVENVQLNHKKILKELKKLPYKKINKFDGINVNSNKTEFTQITESIRILDLMDSGQEINEEISRHIQVSIDHFFGYTVDSKIINSWGTKSSHNSIADWHSHSNFWLSAVYYPHGTKKDNFNLMFNTYKPFAWTPRVKEHNILNQSAVKIEVVEGDLLIFPSDLRHKIGENCTAKDRYSIAFNILPNGEIGDSDSYLEYKLS